jgi:predicted RNA-binding Zn-ribbon protein involved in translation (DUF1610 family)
MPFTTSVKWLRGSQLSRFDKIERKVENIENSLIKEKVVDVPIKSPPRQVSIPKQTMPPYTPYGPGGPGGPYGVYSTMEPIKVPTRKGSRKVWILEYNCPKCGHKSKKGWEHLGVNRKKAGANYKLKIKCENCGWESKPVKISAT